jgi:hypothetical protein
VRGYRGDDGVHNHVVDRITRAIHRSDDKGGISHVRRYVYDYSGHCTEVNDTDWSWHNVDRWSIVDRSSKHDEHTDDRDSARHQRIRRTRNGNHWWQEGWQCGLACGDGAGWCSYCGTVCGGWLRPALSTPASTDPTTHRRCGQA